MKKKILLTASVFACALTGLAAVACEKTEEITYQFNTMCEDVTVQNVTVKKGEEFTLPVPESRGKEWEFAGWYLTDNFAGSAVEKAVAQADAIYYAKWDRLYKIDLDIKGGTLENIGDLYLKAGENVSAYLAEYVPVKAGYEFGEWLKGTTAIGGNERMPADTLTLTARYKVGYTVDVYTQSIEYLRADDKTGLDEYEKETLTRYDYAQADFSVEYAPRGFIEVDKVDSVVEGELKETPEAGDNHFVIYFDREQYTLTLNSNVPESSQPEVSDKYYYDEVVELPYDLYMNVGYVFAGWSESASGENDYPIDFIDAVLYNADESGEVKREKEYRANSDATLYAYWNKGYTNLFGGADTIFLLNENSQNIYLFRGGKYFKGEYSAKDKQFTFFDKKDNILLEGRVLADNKFCYSDESRSEISAKLYDASIKGGVNENVTLTLGLFNDLTYTEKDDKGVQIGVANGTFTLDTETGEFTAYFDGGTGDMVGRTIHFFLRTMKQTGKTVVQVRNEEEYALGTVGRLFVNGGSITMLQNPIYYSITFSGYGDAVYYNGTSPVNCYYSYNAESDTYKLTNSLGKTIGTVKLMSEGGFEGYMLYDDELDQEFNCGEGTLRLDGLARATYVSGTTVASGFYTTSSSYLGDYIISFTDNGTNYTFLLKSQTEGTGSNQVTVYTLEKKPDGYAEYVYFDLNDDGESTLFFPVLVMNDESNGKANLYVNFEGKATKAASGTYTLDSESGLYTLTDIDRVQGVEYTGSKLDLSQISAFVFAIDTERTSNSIFYIYSQTDLANSKTLNTKEYTPVDKNGAPVNDGSSLLIVGAIALLSEKNEGGTLIGTYATDKNGVTVMTISNGSSVSYIYLEITEDKGTFLRYESSPYTAYLYREDGTFEQYETINFDGKGGLTYQYRVTDGGETKTVIYTGTVEAAGTTGSTTIYRFTGTTDSTLVEASERSITFRYVLATNSGYLFFSKISDNEGTFTSASEGTLVLDGSGFSARYSDTFGNTYSGNYRARTGNIVYMYVNNEYKYFELNLTDNTFTVIGSELGTYIIMDNQVADGRFVEFNGKGAAILSRLDDAEKDNRKTIDENATYTINDDGTITIRYTENSVSGTLIGRTGVMQVGNNYYSTFFIHYDSIANIYVNEADYSVLELNDAGSAIRYTQTGSAERGSYTLITDKAQSGYNLLYYVNAAGTFATLYEYDTERNLIVGVENADIAYCNKDLSSLMFTKYGFAIFDGTTRYYYFKEGNDVAIYRVAKDGETANKYGFVKDTITGGLANKIHYNDTDYYKNGGYDITFKRDANSGEKLFFPDGDKKYTLESITFALSGSSEFSVAGKITLSYDNDGKRETVTKDCTIIRSLKESDGSGESKYETYVMIGFFRYDIEVSFDEEPTLRTYTLDKMSLYIDAESSIYMQNVMMYMMYGMNPASVPFFGHVTVWQDYDANGEAGQMYMTGKFSVTGDDGKEVSTIQMYGWDGSVINFEQQPCVVENQNGTDVYTVTVTHADGFTYKGVFTFSTSYGVVVYNMAGFYREQKITTSDHKFEVTVGRIVTSENQNNAPNQLVVLTLKDLASGTEIEAEYTIKINGDWHIVSRTYDDPDSPTKKIVSSTYYKIVLTEEEESSINKDFVKPYKEVAVTEINDIKTVYTADGSTYVDINTADHKVMIFGKYIAASTDSFTQDAVSGTEKYIVTTASGRKYQILVTYDEEDNQTAEIQTYVEPDEAE